VFVHPPTLRGPPRSAAVGATLLRTAEYIARTTVGVFAAELDTSRKKLVLMRNLLNRQVAEATDYTRSSPAFAGLLT
jgi:hypothetical protein